MADRIETPAVTIPAGTLEAAPQTTALSLRDAVLERIEVRIPPGPSGLVGFALLHSGQQVIPFREGDWIITDDESLDWAVERYPTGDKWSVRGYNTDIYPHTLYLRLHFREVTPVVSTAGQPILIVSQSSAMEE